MKTVLLVSPHLPYKNVGHAGGKAIHDFIIELKKRGFKVCLLSLVLPEEMPELAGVRSVCDDASFVVSRPVFFDGFLSCFLKSPVSLLWKLPRAVLKHFRIRRSLRRGLARLIRLHSPDVIQVEYSSMAMYLSRIRSGKLKMLHLHDLMIKPAERRYRGENKLAHRAAAFLFLTLTRRMELSFCRKFDRILAKSALDRDLLRKHGNFDVRVFPLGIEPVSSVRPRPEREPGSILFVGAMFREVNERAALYFAREVLPLLKNRFGRVKFYVVGSAPSEQLKAMEGEDIEITGFVEDVGLFYNRCQVFVAPLFWGGGMIFKILQAMSFGVPVVASSIANEGILARDGEEILVADTPGRFCGQIARVLEEPELWTTLSERARAFVEAEYSWDVVVNGYLKSCGIEE